MSKEEIKLALHEQAIKDLTKKVDVILENHLPHLQEGIEDIKVKQAYWSGGMAILMIAAEYFISKLTH